MKQFPGTTPAELEYRAKLVEQYYSGNLGLLQKFLSTADARKSKDSHALACAQIKLAFAHTNQADLSRIQTKALELLHAHPKILKENYTVPDASPLPS